MYVERLENWKFSQVPTHRSVQASEASESKSILATIDLEKALLSRAIFMVGRALGKCPFSNGHNTECCVRSSLKKCVAFGQCICIL